MDIVISWIIVWLLGPLILLAIVGGTIFYAYTEAENKGIAGIAAGFVILILYIAVTQNNKLQDIHIGVFWNSIWGYVLLFLIGTIIGAALYWLVETFQDHSLIAFAGMIIIATSSSAFYSYFFYSSIRDTIESVALGILFGVLVRFIFSKEPLRSRY